MGGENVPYKGTSGAGGLFSRIFGNRANEMNIEAQQQQAAEMRDKEAREDERRFELQKIAETDKPIQRRFEEAAAARKAELQAEREARKGEREQDRADRLARETAEERRRAQEREDRLTQWREENALKDAIFGQSKLQADRPSMTGLPGGGLAISDPRSGAINIVNPGTVGFGNFPGTPPSTRQVYPQVKAPANTSGGSMVDRITGATLGGPLPTTAGAAAPKAVAPTRPSLMNMIGAGAENVADALGLEGFLEVPAALGDLLTPDTKTLEKAARSRARYLNPSMQRTY